MPRPPDPETVRRTYDHRARLYDIALTAFAGLGFRSGAYRRSAVAALELVAGATVVDLGCGTGRNLPLLAERVGPTGRVVGVDFSAGALARAARRTQPGAVELVRADAAAYPFPASLDAVLATFSLSMMADPAAVLERAAAALRPGGRLVVLDFRVPDSWPRAARWGALALARPFGETRAMARQDLRALLPPGLCDVRKHTFYSGAVYLIAAQAPMVARSAGRTE